MVWPKGKKRSPETIRKISLRLKGNMPDTRGDKNSRWKGGYRIIHGHRVVYTPDHPYPSAGKNVSYEHRLVMEKHLGRYLLPEEVVHHIDGDKLNNVIENLMLFKNDTEHRAYHKYGGTK